MLKRSNLTDPSQLTPLQMKAAGAMLEGLNIQSAATIAGCSENSIDRWLKIPAFQTVIQDGKDAAFQVASTRLAKGAYTAVLVLEDVMNDADVKPADRIRAADMMLSHAIRVAEIVTLQNRISNLENMVGEDE